VEEIEGDKEYGWGEYYAQFDESEYIFGSLDDGASFYFIVEVFEVILVGPESSVTIAVEQVVDGCAGDGHQSVLDLVHIP
jgi:hypothetical protein